VSHLTEDELVAWRDNANDDGGLIEAHLAECPACAAAYESLLQSPRVTELEFSEDLALATADAPLYFKPSDLVGPTYSFQRDPRTAAKPFGRFAWRAWASIFAVVAIVTALMGFILTRSQTSTRALATPSNDTIEVTSTNADPHTKIQWRADVTAATQYQVVLKDDAGTVVFGLVTVGSSASLPSEIVDRLQPERTYTWTITALDAAANPKATTSRSFSIDSKR
jgi:hypothetical protein